MFVRLQGDVHQALIVLQKGVAQCFPDDQPLVDSRSLQTKGKAMLLVGRFMEETANFESNAIMKAYKVTATEGRKINIVDVTTSCTAKLQAQENQVNQ